MKTFILPLRVRWQNEQEIEMCVVQSSDGSLTFAGMELWLSPNPLREYPNRQRLLARIIHKDWEKMRNADGLIIELDKWAAFFKQNKQQDNE